MSKMTYNEIIKAFRCCADIHDKCTECPLKDKDRESCVGILMSNALATITRQKVENERLQQNLKEAHIDIRKHLAEIKRLENSGRCCLFGRHCKRNGW